MSYTDGVWIERCETCQSALRATDGEPLVYLRLSDVKAAMLLLQDRIPSGWTPMEFWPLIGRLQDAVGLAAGDPPQRPA